MNVTTRKAARPDWAQISPLAACEQTATHQGHPFLNWVQLVIHFRGNIEESLIR
jgi:hypothetical protein